MVIGEVTIEQTEEEGFNQTRVKGKVGKRKRKRKQSGGSDRDETR